MTGTSVTSASTSGGSDGDSGLGTGAIIGIVVGCVVFIAIVGFIVCYLGPIIMFANMDRVPALMPIDEFNHEMGESDASCSPKHKVGHIEANPIAKVPEMGHADHVPENL